MRQVFQVIGMRCESCAASLQGALENESQVTNARVTFEPARAQFDSASPMTPQDLAKLTASLGSYEFLPADNQTSGDNRTMPIDTTRTADAPASKWVTYRPLLIIVGLLMLVALVVESRQGEFRWSHWMADFMGGFFVVFAFFKLLDLPKFVSAFSRYDVVAARVPAYAWSYPFLELTLGFGYLARVYPTWINWGTLIVTTVGTIGVLQTLRAKRVIQCACLGTVFKLPMSSVTVIENTGMALMALAMLLAS